jgi:NAD(P)-dependent dehydrogenase (short-subunit alcohol dehydrogenase family)
MRTMKDLMDLSGRSALITGGAGHIGGAAASVLVELGATVSILDFDISAAQARIDDLADYGNADGVALSCDLLDEKETRNAIQRAIKSTGSLDILVHCAAYVGTTRVPGWAVPFEEQTVEAWDAAMRVNLTSAFTMVQEGKQALGTADRGSVIFFASHYGMVGPDMRLYDGTEMANPAGYAASKGGVIQLTRYLSTVLAPKIRVNSISPGGVWREQPEEFHKAYVYRTPMGRMAAEEDLKGAVAYLASDMSAYVTGHNLVVDGGFTAW